MHRQFRTACSRSTSSPVSVGARTHESFPRPRPVLLGALLALLLLGAASAQALAVSKRQVSTNCNTPCKDPSIPCYTSFSSAISASPSLGPGDTIFVCPGKYYQKATLNSRSGSSSQPIVLQAIGAATLDGSDLYGQAAWTQYSADVYRATYTPAAAMNPPSSQVFVGGVRYTYVAGTSFASLAPEHYGYSPTLDSVYVNAGGGKPGQQLTYIGSEDRKKGFDINFSNYLTIDGFTVLRNDQEGINIRGTNGAIDVQSITVKNCTSAQNWGQGVYVRNCSGCVVDHSTAYDNVKHGIYLLTSANCQITHNEAYSNEDPKPTRDGIAGIKIGESNDKTDVSDVTVDYNIVRDNEDTGIDLNGAQRILVRRNVSYHNRDHGYDNNYTAYTTFMNDVAANNDHDGISAENTSSNVAIYNCIFAYNARNGNTLAPGSTEPIAELWVNNALGGFSSNYNVLFGYGLAGWAIGGGQYVHRGLADYNGTLYQSLSALHDASGQDAASQQSDPIFADTTNANYVIYGAASEALDGAETDLTNWLPTDPRGVAPYDVLSVPDWGIGSITYADIGAFEQVPPAALSDLDFYGDPVDCTKFWLTWNAPADDSTFAASGLGTQYDLRFSNLQFSNWTPGGGTILLAPGSPGTAQTYQVGVGFGQHRYFGIKTKDHIGLWSGPGHVVYILGPPAGWTDCFGDGATFAGGGGGGDGFRARPAAGPASVETAAATGFAENTLLNGVAKGTPSADVFRLPAIAASGGNTYRVRIREASDRALALDQARLLTVDHSASVRTFVASGNMVLGTRMAPDHAEDGTAHDITSLVDGSSTSAFKGDSGSVVTVSLPVVAAGSPDPVVIEASGLGWSSSGILVQVPDEASGWRTVGRVQPRAYVDEFAVDSIASAKIRLYLLGHHQLQFIGRVARSTEQPTLQWGQLSSAQDSKLGDALSALSAGTAVTLAGPDTLMMSFAAPKLADGQVRECFIAVHGAPVSASGTSATSLRASGTEPTPARFALRQNEPNPFSVATTIRFALPTRALARLEVFDIEGRLVKVVASHYFTAGEQAVQWDRRDEAGVVVRPGVYLYRLAAGPFRSQKKMVLMP